MQILGPFILQLWPEGQNFSHRDSDGKLKYQIVWDAD